MADYRAYRIKNNHVDGIPTVITCDNDEEAIKQAKQLVNGADIELWEGARFVRGIKSTEAA
jgi:predicted O-methyltransferase YrrM